MTDEYSHLILRLVMDDRNSIIVIIYYRLLHLIGYLKYYENLFFSFFFISVIFISTIKIVIKKSRPTSGGKME